MRVLMRIIISTDFLGVKGEPLAKYHLALPNVVLSYNMCQTCWIVCGESLCTISDKIFAIRGSFLTYRMYRRYVT